MVDTDGWSSDQENGAGAPDRHPGPARALHRPQYCEKSVLYHVIGAPGEDARQAACRRGRDQR